MLRARFSCACLGLVLLTSIPVLAGPTYTLFSDPLGGEGTTTRYGVNNAGDYVGSFLSGGVYYGFAHTSGGFSPVAPTDPVGYHPIGINNVNGIVGYYQDSSGTHGFVRQGGTYSSLNIAGAKSTYAYGTNDNGQVVGYYVDSEGVSHGFSEIGGVVTTIDVPNAVATYVTGVNNSGEMVGSYYDGTYQHAFVYDDGEFRTIDYPDAPYTFAAGINNHGDVVGWYGKCVACPQIGFLLDSGGAYTSIAPIYGLPTYLTGINDHDQIMLAIIAGANDTGSWVVDIGGLIGGPPIGPEPTRIPEPGTQVLMAAGGVLLLALKRFLRRA